MGDRSVSDIFRHIKAHFNSSMSHHRSSSGETPPNHRDKPKRYRPTMEQLVKAHKRRKDMENAGFFCPARVPYKCAGKVALDLGDLLLNRLGIQHLVTQESLSRLPQLQMRSKLTKKKNPTDAKTETEAEEEEANLVVEETRLRTSLLELTKRIRGLKAGQTWNDCKAEYESNMAKLVDGEQTDSLSLNWEKLLKSPDYRLYMNSTCLNEFENLEKSTTGRDPIEVERERYYTARAENEFVMKLSAIYVIICCICYMKSRDLKKKRPFDGEKVKKLKRNLPRDSHGHVILPPNVPSDKYNMGISPPSQSVRIQSALMRTPVGQRQQSTVNFKSPFRRLNAKNRKSSATRLISRLETWDELMAVGENGDWSSSASVIPKRTVFIKPFDNQRSRKGIEAGQDTLTLWQKMMLIQDEEEDEVSLKKLKKNQERGEKSPEEQVKTLLRKFRQTERKAATSLQENLDNYKTDADDLLLEKMKRLRFQTSWDVNGDLAWIRRDAKDQLKLRRTRAHENEYGSSKWFAKLYREFRAVFGKEERSGSDSESEKRYREAVELLEVLKKISSEPISNLPQAKAKLCLLAFSLPAVEVCSKAVADGFQTVLHDMYGCKASHYADWMKTRKLPAPLPLSQSLHTYTGNDQFI